MKEKNIILAARTISIVFTPFYLPVLGLVALFMLSYLNRLVPWYYKLTVIMMVYLFTVLLPTLLIHLYRKYQGWTLHELGMKERRMVPYIISIVCYFACYYIMNLYHIPHHGTRHPDYLCAHQRLVEDIYPLGSHRWRDRCIDVVCLVVSLQSYLVALFGHLVRRIGGV